MDLEERGRAVLLGLGKLGSRGGRRGPPAEAEIAPRFDIGVARKRTLPRTSTPRYGS